MLYNFVPGATTWMCRISRFNWDQKGSKPALGMRTSAHEVTHMLENGTQLNCWYILGRFVWTWRQKLHLPRCWWVVTVTATHSPSGHWTNPIIFRLKSRAYLMTAGKMLPLEFEEKVKGSAWQRKGLLGLIWFIEPYAVSFIDLKAWGRRNYYSKIVFLML